MASFIIEGKINSRGSEHYYTRTGRPSYDSNIRDARKLGLLPSPTTILGTVSNWSLDQWKKRNTAEKAMDILHDREAITQPQWDEAMEDTLKRSKVVDWIVGEADQVAKDAATFGTSIHEGAEGILTKSGWDEENETLQFLNGYLEEVCENVIWSEENLVHPGGLYAGRADTLFRHEEHGIVLCDFKTQKFTKTAAGKWRARFYPNYVRQLAAYAGCLKPMPRILSVAINSLVPMPPVEKLYTLEEQEQAWQTFLALAEYWVLDRKYDPREFEAAPSEKAALEVA